MRGLFFRQVGLFHWKKRIDELEKASSKLEKNGRGQEAVLFSCLLDMCLAIIGHDKKFLDWTEKNDARMTPDTIASFIDGHQG